MEPGRSNWRRGIATLLGAGLLPKAPGTWGSLLTTIFLWPILSVAGASTIAWCVILITGVLLFSILCVIIGRYAVIDFGHKDPGPFVLDEAAGICLTLLFVPHCGGGRLILTLLVAFAAFRLFDVTKPPPARNLEKLPGGWGILLDDLAAGVYANLVCQVVLRIM
jgi:phosphatidylglycerophosphatase A